MARPIKPSLALAAGALLPFVVAACGSTVSTSKFKGEQREVAQAISNLQSDARAGDQTKLCANDLAGPVVARLSIARGGCKEALKGQLTQLDNFDVTVESVLLAGTPAKRTATAKVKSVYNGKKRITTVSLVKEGGKWKTLSVM
jgi:hypothetical protein